VNSVLDGPGYTDPPLLPPNALAFNNNDNHVVWSLEGFSWTPVWLASSNFDLQAISSAIMDSVSDSIGGESLLLDFEHLDQQSLGSEEPHPR
jgi:hypothetical protein